MSMTVIKGLVIVVRAMGVCVHTDVDLEITVTIITEVWVFVGIVPFSYKTCRYVFERLDVEPLSSCVTNTHIFPIAPDAYEACGHSRMAWFICMHR